MITNFKIFEGTCLGNNCISNNKEYLLSFMTTRNNIDFPKVVEIPKMGKKIRIEWNDKSIHDMLERINRYSDLSKEDFIKLVKKSLNIFIPTLKEKGREYCIHLTNRRLYILFFVYDRPIYSYSSDQPNLIYIRTILPQLPDSRYGEYTLIDIDDSLFLV